MPPAPYFGTFMHVEPLAIVFLVLGRTLEGVESSGEVGAQYPKGQRPSAGSYSSPFQLEVDTLN